uniref:WAP domain-containing protein n=1 Tax=Chromera velia CCMP2878 TaxID=1169474 RepID=A0A0G4FJ56_9ALVE|eukprot:Cvel_17106.t1-p1 / transcript=Cvel_17106.t1 / gene=Cvel_17106 / organism=Chromera_velia_CCMP2878 / gene_product=hypothetical protein / transcript_product=hypothetical protein / location=Cvel_scaffold1348:45984-47407(+) / protein_length=219 / sequence_SO=supercontig / SO=protein_coding / is_pseudo=false
MLRTITSIFVALGIALLGIALLDISPNTEIEMTGAMPDCAKWRCEPVEGNCRSAEECLLKCGCAVREPRRERESAEDVDGEGTTNPLNVVTERAKEKAREREVEGLKPEKPRADSASKAKPPRGNNSIHGAQDISFILQRVQGRGLTVNSNLRGAPPSSHPTCGSSGNFVGFWYRLQWHELGILSLPGHVQWLRLSYKHRYDLGGRLKTGVCRRRFRIE